MTKTVIKAHKIKLNPTPEQAEYFWRSAGIARFTWNWALGEYNRRKEAGEKVKIVGKGDTLKAEFTQLKKELCWLSEVSTYVGQQPFADLQKAISRFFKLQKQGKLNKKGQKPRKDGKSHGWPRFKSRGKSTPSFYVSNISLRPDGHNLFIEKCPGNWVNGAEELRFVGKIMGARVTYRGGSWWISVQVETEIEERNPSDKAVGVDLGIKYLAALSDPISVDNEDVLFIDNPKAYQKAQRKLRRLQRKLDRQRRANNPQNYNENGTAKRGVAWETSNRMKETERKIATLHQRIANIRNDASHKMTTAIAERYGVIGVEDLNVDGMKQNKRLAKAISDAALHEKRRQLTYKAEWNGGDVVPVSRWFPSSKMCSECGWINAELKLSDRQWTCLECGTVHDRDGNAAANIKNEAIAILINEKESPCCLGGDDKHTDANSGNGRIVREPHDTKRGDHLQNSPLRADF